MSDINELLRACTLTRQLQSGFKDVADLLGAEKAFYLFAGEVVKANYPLETEEKFVAIIRAAYDDYVKGAA